MRAISVSLPVSLAQAVKEHARAHGTSYADLLMDSVLAQRAQLSELVSRRRRDRPRDELFVRSTPRGGEEPFVSLSLRMLAPNVAALDSLVAEHNASSRSELCAAALRAHLAGP
jgi:metal-responsive CopG/Arc/MetJ family transcriptional regulator